MRDGEAVLLYGAGAEARSTRTFLASRFPASPVLVTADSGDAAIEDAEFLPPEALESAITARRFATIVKSPGVSLYKPVFSAARAAGIAVTSNLNLWGRYLRGDTRVIAITGTKGKSTTATLCQNMLAASGIEAGLGGNVGVPPLDLGAEHDWVVMELSSYQTADVDFAPDIIGLTTLFPEHIDWHLSRERYFADKLNLLAVAPEARLGFGPQAATHPLTAPYRAEAARLLPALEDAIVDAIYDAAPETRLRGQHNLDNALLAATLAAAAGASEDGILDGIRAFTPLPHRLADVTIGSHVFVDDSISTTPEATRAALAAFADTRVALIAGGYDRQQDYEPLAEEIGRTGLALVVTLPDTGTRLAEALSRHAPQVSQVSAPDLKAAMTAIALRKSQFDTVILSPGAPSYNQFRNFGERGDAFIRLARQMFSD